MITKQDILDAIKKCGGAEHFHKLCFRHADLRHRAGFQAIFFQRAAGWTGSQQHPPEDLIRQTPAGQKIPPDESPLIQTTCKKCGGTTAVCELEPDTIVGPDGFLLEDAE